MEGRMQSAQEDQQLRLLLAQLHDKVERAEQGIFTHTDFLTPREARRAVAQLKEWGQAHRACLYGGYDNAERACLLLFPDYMTDALGDEPTEPLCEVLSSFGQDSPVTALYIRASGYRELTHRDYLGSLLSLGLERSVLGDIAVDEQGATVLCLARIKPFLLSHVERIGGDAVKVREICLPPDFDGGRRYLPVSDTVASPRLDCVVASLANCSREAAQSAVRNGEVELDYECEMRLDRTVEVPCVISVRGVGKFAIRQLSERTKKGRLRLVADRYV